MATIFFGHVPLYAAAMSSLPPSRTAPKIMIRLPEGMRELIAEAAERNGRSMNAEIVARLDRSFDADAETNDFTARMREFEADLRDMRARILALDIPRRSPDSTPGD